MASGAGSKANVSEVIGGSGAQARPGDDGEEPEDSVEIDRARADEPVREQVEA
jgi:hypothetical protein